ncbi:type II toxin-antitoxin system VapC family toxin [Saccharomonospora piscinae]|uniref:type II toxin-antitoxin system VapC family toxin n=1 Tax=Saccharomonospora piscinae TaxID=687388 RepID=UPI0004663D4C|nr:type II toxin-antitoxin system VapC family toxin [Saccharomonospora piscinae]
MIVYYDTSAFVPLLVLEPSSASCRRLWNDADSVVTTRLLYVEAAAALAQAWRQDRLTAAQHHAARQLLDELWGAFDVVEVGAAVAGRAAELAVQHELRGYDAVHCASSDMIRSSELVVACGDTRLLKACAALGLATADTNSGGQPGAT